MSHGFARAGGPGHHGPPGPGPRSGGPGFCPGGHHPPPPGPGFHHPPPPGPGFHHPPPPGPFHPPPPGPGFHHPPPPGPGFHPPPPGPGFHPPPPGPGFYPPPPGPGPRMPPPPGPGFYPPPPGPAFVPGPPPPGGFPGGYPVFRGQMAPNMYFKPVWSPKREAKLQRVWREVSFSGRVGIGEIQRLLAAFHYMVSPYEAQWFYNSLDRNRDGRIEYAEVRAAMQEFIMTYPRVRNPNKMHLNKPWYAPGYNWRSHPGFPGQYGHLWRW